VFIVFSSIEHSFRYVSTFAYFKLERHKMSCGDDFLFQGHSL